MLNEQKLCVYVVQKQRMNLALNTSYFDGTTNDMYKKNKNNSTILEVFTHWDFNSLVLIYYFYIFDTMI